MGFRSHAEARPGRFKSWLAAALAAVVILGASGDRGAADENGAPRPAIGKWGVETRSLARGIRPGDDFYRYVNQGWLKTAVIPPGYSSIDEFTVVDLDTVKRVDDLVVGLAAAPQAPGSTEQRVADFYRSYMDEARLDALGLDPIRGELDAILAIDSRAALARSMAMPFHSGPIASSAGSDPGNPQRSLPVISQSDLVLPARDFYLSDEAPYPELRAALAAYVAASFDRAGIADGAARAEAILALETEMARLHWTMAELRDRVRMYHTMTPAELEAFAPGFDWAAFLDQHGFAGRETLNVATDTAVQALARLYAETPLETWRSYVAFRFLDAWAPYLSKDWRDASFDFHYRLLAGLSERQPRSDEAITLISEYIPDDIGRLYAERYFRPEAKAEVEEMIGYLRAAYRERIAQNDWMDDATRGAAIAKLDRIVDHIGFPDRYRDFSTIGIVPDDLVGNLRRITDWWYADNRAQLDEPRRDWEWSYPANEINAGYSPSLNSITFPAGILQPPFFDPAADPAVNFGAIGAVIGHEIGHAFDDQGSRFDGDGRLRDWWTATARAEFEARAAMLVAQYDGYSPLPGLTVNGALTLGENIGDLGGLAIAYEAYRRYVVEVEGGAAPMIDGFTGDQRFFLSWAQLWRNVTTPEELRRRNLSDPHSPGEFRVNGVVRNVDGWYEAFGVQPGNHLYLPPEQRVRIW